MQHTLLCILKTPLYFCRCYCRFISIRIYGFLVWRLSQVGRDLIFLNLYWITRSKFWHLSNQCILVQKIKWNCSPALLFYIKDKVKHDPNTAKGETSKSITSFHFFDYFIFIFINLSTHKSHIQVHIQTCWKTAVSQEFSYSFRCMIRQNF